MLSNQQVETFIYQFRQAISELKAQQLNQNSSLTNLQTQLNTFIAANSSTSSGGTASSVTTDSYIVGTGIVHKLKHFFQAAVTFISDVAIQGVLTLSTALGVTYGGTGATTASGARANLSAAALPQTISGSNFTYSGQGSTACGGSQTITVPGSSFTAPSGGGPCTGSFSVTIDGSNFTFSVSSTTLSGSQTLI